MNNNISLPCDIDAEIALIGSVFMDPALITEISDVIEAEDFFDQRHKLIYKAMVTLMQNGGAIDTSTVLSTLNQKNLLQQCGGIEYISQIADSSYSSANVQTYIDLVSNAALKRNAINELNKLAQEGFNPNVEAADYVDAVEMKVFELSKKRKVDAFKNIKEITKNVTTNTENNASRNNDVIGYSTGFRSLDKITQGLQKGALYILAARPAMGKSAMAMNLAINVSIRNIVESRPASVAIFNLEMSAEQLVERMIASEASIKLNQIKSGYLDRNEWIRFQTACQKLDNMNLFFDDSSNSSISSIRAKCRRLKAEFGLDFIVIDYLQLIESDLGSRASTQEKVSRISRGLKLMARELDVPVLALAQLSREVEKRDDKKPIMADLRDSGSIEQDADMVMFLYREDYYNHSSERKGEADLIVAKNRSGSTNNDGLPFVFTGEIQKFREKLDN